MNRYNLYTLNENGRPGNIKKEASHLMGAQGQKFHCESLLNSKIIQSGKMLPVWIQKSNQVCTNPVQSIAIIMNTRVYSSHHDDDHRLFPTGIHSLCSVHREKIRRH